MFMLQPYINETTFPVFRQQQALAFIFGLNKNNYLQGSYMKSYVSTSVHTHHRIKDNGSLFVKKYLCAIDGRIEILQLFLQLEDIGGGLDQERPLMISE